MLYKLFHFSRHVHKHTHKKPKPQVSPYWIQSMGFIWMNNCSSRDDDISDPSVQTFTLITQKSQYTFHFHFGRYKTLAHFSISNWQTCEFVNLVNNYLQNEIKWTKLELAFINSTVLSNIQTFPFILLI